MDGRTPKYIFVTGGVVSSLGKGLAAASIGCLLEGHGYRLAAEVLELALFRLDPTARKELMLIYIEDVRAHGRQPADLVDRKTGNVRYDAAAQLRERGLSGLRLKMR